MIKVLGTILVFWIGFGPIAAHAQFFKYHYKFKNGAELHYLENQESGFLPGLFFKKEGEDDLVPLESDSRFKEGTGKLQFIETQQISSRREYSGEVQVLSADESSMTFALIDHRLIAIEDSGSGAKPSIL